MFSGIMRSYTSWNKVLLSIMAIGMPLVFIPFANGIDIFDSAKGSVLFSVGLIMGILSIISFKKYTLDITDGLLLLWLICILCSVLHSKNWYLGFLGYHKHQGRLEGLLTFIIYFLCFRNARLGSSISMRDINVYLWILTSIVFYALLQFFYLDPLVHYKHFRPTIFSTVGNQNFLASMASCNSFRAFSAIIVGYA